MSSSSVRPKWQTNCEWLALLSLTLCFFTIVFSIFLTTFCFCFSMLLILISGNWQERFKIIFTNFAALSFWIMGIFFIIALFYFNAHAPSLWKGFYYQEWLLFTPFFIAIIKENKWRHRMMNVFLWVMLFLLLLSFLKSVVHFDLLAFINVPPSQQLFFSWDTINHTYFMNIAAYIFAYRCLFKNKMKFFYAVLFCFMAVDILFISKSMVGYGIFFSLFIYTGIMRFGWKGMLLTFIIAISTISAAYYFSPMMRSNLKTSYSNLIHHTQSSLSTEKPTSISIIKSMVNQGQSVAIIFVMMGLLIAIWVIIQIRISFGLPHEYLYLIHVVLIATLLGGIFWTFFNSFQINHLYALFAALCFSAY